MTEALESLNLNRLVVFVEAFAALTTQFAAANHFAQKNVCAVFAVVVVVVENVHNGEANVQAD